MYKKITVSKNEKPNRLIYLHILTSSTNRWSVGRRSTINLFASRSSICLVKTSYSFIPVFSLLIY